MTEYPNIVVFYHGDCFDGLCAAWVVSRAIESHQTELGSNLKAEFIPCKYGEPLPDPAALQGKAVLLLDFSFPRQTMLEIHGRAKSFQVFDHHKTAQKECEGLNFCTFDMERSGAGLAWDYFEGDVRPPLVNYIEDRDLWQFKLPYSAEIHAWIASYEKSFKNYDWMHLELLDNFEDCVKEGQAILRFKNQKVEEMASEARLVTIMGHEVPLANAPYQFGSDVGHRLLELYPDKPFAAYFLIDKEGTYRYGLRGRDTDDFDVSEIAKKMGGGGHKKAAGYTSR